MNHKEKNAADASQSGEKTIACLRCGQTAIYSARNPSRPFCSERCRLIDLGVWASESYRIPEQSPPDGALDNDSN